MIIRQERILEYALADLPHHLVIEEDVVLQALLVGGMTVLLLVLVPWVRRLTGEATR